MTRHAWIAGLLLVLATCCRAQIMSQPEGAFATNVSSDSSQFVYTSLWRSDTEDGFYQAYSNLSDASVTFTFTGVGATFWSVRKADRGLCQLVVDNTVAYTIDLYDDSGFTKGQQAIWSSGTLLYGQHTITLSQIGPDARFGFYPYLITEIWTEYVPTNIAAYTATESIPSPMATSSGGNRNNSAPTSVAPIIGGVVGGVVALILISFLLYLWRRDKRTQERAKREGKRVHKVRKAEGNMSIEDETLGPSPSGGPGQNQYGAYGPIGAYGPGPQMQQVQPRYGTDPYHDPYNQQQQPFQPMASHYVHSPLSQPHSVHYPQPGSMHGQDPSISSVSYSSHHPIAQNAGSYGQRIRTLSTPSNNSLYAPGVASSQSGHYPSYDPTQRDVNTRSPRDYPFVTQNLADEQRRLPVPEI